MKRRTSSVCSHFAQPDDERKLKCHHCEAKLSVRWRHDSDVEQFEVTPPGVKWGRKNCLLNDSCLCRKRFLVERSRRTSPLNCGLTQLLTSLLHMDWCPWAFSFQSGHEVSYERELDLFIKHVYFYVHAVCFLRKYSFRNFLRNTSTVSTPTIISNT